MKVDVRDFLAAVGARVDDQPISVAQTFVCSDLGRDDDAAAHGLLVLVRQIRERHDLAFGDDQDVRGSFGGNVTKRQAQVVFVDDVSRDFFGDDFRKDGWHVAIQTEVAGASN